MDNETYDYEDYQDLGGDDSLTTTTFADEGMSNSSSSSALAGGLAASGTSMILAFVMLIVIFVAKIKIFTKAGRAWWKAIIPVYRDYCTFQIARMPGWLALLPFLEILLLLFTTISGASAILSGSFAAGGMSMFLIIATGIVSVAFSIAQIILNFRMAKVFGHGIGFGFGLWLLSPVFYMILAFGKSEYIYDDADDSGNDDNGYGGYDNGYSNGFDNGNTPSGTPDGGAGGGFQNMQADYGQYGQAAQPDYTQYSQPQGYQNQDNSQYGQPQDYGQYGQTQTQTQTQAVQYDNNGLASATLPQDQQTPSYNDFYGQGTNGMQPTPDNYGQGTTGIQTAPDSYSQSTSGMQSTPDNYGQGTSGMQSSPDGYGQGTSGMQSNPGNYGQGMTQPDAGGYNAYGYQQPQMSQGQFNAPYGSQGSYGYNGYANGFDNGSNSNQQ